MGSVMDDQERPWERRERERSEPIRDTIKVPLCVFLKMLVTEMHSRASDQSAILNLANTVQEIADSIRK